MSSMTPRERMLTVLNHKRPDRTPFHFKLSPVLFEQFKERTGTDNVSDYFGFDMRNVAQKPTIKTTDFSKYLPNLNDSVVVDEFGIGRVAGSKFHFQSHIHPLQNLSFQEIKDYPFPDIAASYRSDHFKERTVELHNNEYFVTGSVGHIFETCWAMRGMEDFLIDMMANEEIAYFLVRTITDMREAVAKNLASAGVDMISIADDIGTQRGLMMAPELWRKLLKPVWKKVIDSAKKISPDIYIYYHSDGDIREVLGDLIEIGVDVLNPIQPESMDPIGIKRVYGNDITLWGTIGTQTTMPFASPLEVKKVVESRIEKLGMDGGLVLAPTHMLEPEVPWENIDAFVDAAQKPLNGSI